VFTVSGTTKFLDRAAAPVVPETALQASTTMLGDWYVTVLFWRPQVALFANEATRHRQGYARSISSYA
jgi:hypothetical protein